MLEGVTNHLRAGGEGQRGKQTTAGEEELKRRIAELEKENEATLVRLGSQLAALHVEKNKLTAQLKGSNAPGEGGNVEQLLEDVKRLTEENKALVEKMEEVKKDKEDVVGKLADQFSMLQDQIALGMVYPGQCLIDNSACGKGRLDGAKSEVNRKNGGT